ncbi:MAG: hypothetical protein M5U34_16705 [Chloroflexi bacterium]|nr:hypothetical protein [Chloroflexota bacterium]
MRSAASPYRRPAAGARRSIAWLKYTLGLVQQRRQRLRHFPAPRTLGQISPDAS